MFSSIQKSILLLLWELVVANRSIIQDELFPNDRDGSATRDPLRRLTLAKLIDRIEIRPNEFVTVSAPVYMPNQSGCALLAAETGDMRHLLSGVPPKRRYNDFPHYLQVTRLLLEMKKAFAAQESVDLARLVLEHQYVNPEEPDPAKHRMLFTPVGKGKGGGTVVCAPDFATLVRVGKHSRLYLWEFETGSDSPGRVAAKKTPGYHLFHNRGVHRELFPDAQDMRVIAVCPNDGWREALRRSLRDKQGKELWLVASRGDLRRDGVFLREPTFWDVVEGAARPLVRRPPLPPTSTEAVGQGGGGGGVAGTNGSAEKTTV